MFHTKMPGKRNSRTAIFCPGHLLYVRIIQTFVFNVNKFLTIQIKFEVLFPYSTNISILSFCFCAFRPLFCQVERINILKMVIFCFFVRKSPGIGIHFEQQFRNLRGRFTQIFLILQYYNVYRMKTPDVPVFSFLVRRLFFNPFFYDIDKL